MPIREAAIAGISTNGRQWKFTAKGIKRHIDAMEDAYEARDVEACKNILRGIAKDAKSALSRTDELKERYIDECSFSVEDMWFFFEEDVPSFEFGDEGDPECFKENFNHHLNTLYDIFDYERILVK